MTQQTHSQAYTLRKPKWKKYICFLLFIAALFTVARTWKQPRCPSTDAWIRKLWYIDTMEYYSAIKRNTFESVLMRWMSLEPIIQSEVSQKEKDKYRILTRIYGIQKNGIECIYRAAVEKQTQRIDLWTWERGGEGKLYIESNMETYITICKIDSQWEFAVWLRKSNSGSVSIQRGGIGRKMGGKFKREGYVYTYG